MHCFYAQRYSMSLISFEESVVRSITAALGGVCHNTDAK